MAIKLSRKKSGIKISTDRSGKRQEPKWEGAQEWNGKQFNTFKHFAFDYYRMETKSTDNKKFVIQWINNSEQWQEHSKLIG